MWAHQHRHVLGMYTVACMLSCVTWSLNWSESWHWFILYIMPQIDLSFHPCHSQNSFISRCLKWKQWLIQSLEYAGLKMHPNENFCSGCWLKLKHSVGNVMRNRTTIIFPFSKARAFGSVTALTSCSTARLEAASSSLALMRQASVTITSELSACNICRGCVLANVICAHTSATAGNCYSLLGLILPCDVNALCGLWYCKCRTTLTDCRVIRLIVVCHCSLVWLWLQIIKNLCWNKVSFDFSLHSYIFFRKMAVYSTSPWKQHDFIVWNISRVNRWDTGWHQMLSRIMAWGGQEDLL